MREGVLKGDLAMKRSVDRAGHSLPILHRDDLSFQRFDLGFSVYRDIVVLWDDDFDTRVLDWIDSLTDETRQKLAAAQENEGNLYLLWHSEVPFEYRVNGEVEAPKGDIWAIAKSSRL